MTLRELLTALAMREATYPTRLLPEKEPFLDATVVVEHQGGLLDLTSQQMRWDAGAAECGLNPYTLVLETGK